MQLTAILLALASASSVVTDLHTYANYYSPIQPFGNDNSCSGAKRDEMWTRNLDPNPLTVIQKRSYADNAAVIKQACAGYKARNTGSNKWDTYPDCSVGKRHQAGGSECTVVCKSAAVHIGGDEFKYYCKMFGADGSYAY